MRRIWIIVASALAIAMAGGYAQAQEKQPGATQEMQQNRDPPPGAENMEKKGERAQIASPDKRDETRKGLSRKPEDCNKGCIGGNPP